MINLLIKGIFWVITQLFNTIFSPIFSIIFTFFPSLGQYFNYITSYLQLSLTYVRTCLSLLMINDNMIIALFDYFVILYSIHLTLLAVRFALKIYQKFKI